MRQQIRVLVSIIGILLTAAALPAFEIHRSRTSAGIELDASGALVLQLAFRAELLDRLPDLVRADVVVGWQQVGGVEPSPFRVLIPAGCFEAGRNGSRVEDALACGAEATFGSEENGRTVLSLVDLDARVVSREDGTTRFDLRASILPPDPIHPLLGALGGAAVSIVLGSESAVSLPLRIETVSGIDPTPF
jgi:hypothetical protein